MDLYIINDIVAYKLICDKAVKNGKNTGDSMQEEFDETIIEHPEWFDKIGKIDKDIDMLTGELREMG